MVMEGHVHQPDRAPPARQELHDLTSQSNSSGADRCTRGTNVPGLRLEVGHVAAVTFFHTLRD